MQGQSDMRAVNKRRQPVGDPLQTSNKGDNRKALHALDPPVVVDFTIGCLNLPMKDGTPPDPVVGLYQIDFDKSVAQFLSNTEPVISSCNPRFDTVLSLQRYTMGSSLVVALYVYNTHTSPAFGTGGMLEAKPEDCAGYCVLNLLDVSKQSTVDIEYPLRHPEQSADQYLSQIQAKLCVRMQFRAAPMEDAKDEVRMYHENDRARRKVEGDQQEQSNNNNDPNGPYASKCPMKPSAHMSVGMPLAPEVWSRPSRLSFR